MPLRVFYIDDEPDICQFFKDAYDSEEVVVTTFIDPKDALSHFEKGGADLIFVDFRMPGMNGEQFAALIGDRAPIVLLTGDLEITKSTRFLKKLAKQPYPWDEIESVLKEFRKK